MSGVFSVFLDPFAFEFMRQALAMALFVALVSGLLSPFLVLKGWSLMGDAIAHAVLPGIVIAYILAVPLALGAFVAGMVCALATGYLKENSRVKEDTAMGVVFSGMFALGVVLFAKIETDVHLNHVLFGDILGVTWANIAETALIATVASALLIAKRRDLMNYVFDPQHAQAIGLPVRVLHYGLLAIVSLTVVAALKAVGMILAIAFLIAPGAIAFMLTDRFERMLVISVLIALGASFAGIVLAFHIDSAPAPTIVVGLTVAFIVAFIAAPKRGLLAVARLRRAREG